MLSSSTFVASRITRNTPTTMIAATKSDNAGSIQARRVSAITMPPAMTAAAPSSVAQHVKERRAHVRVAPALTMQHEADANVERETDRGDDRHRERVRLDRSGEPAKGRVYAMTTVATISSVPFTSAPRTSMRPYPNVRRGSAGRAAPAAATSASPNAKRSTHTCTASLVSAKLCERAPPQNSSAATKAVATSANVRPALRRHRDALGFERLEREGGQHRAERQEGACFPLP